MENSTRSCVTRDLDDSLPTELRMAEEERSFFGGSGDGSAAGAAALLSLLYSLLDVSRSRVSLRALFDRTSLSIKASRSCRS